MKPRHFIAQFSDLGGPTNPTAILSPKFLALKLAVERGDDPGNILQALYDWLGEKNVTPRQLDKVLEMEPEAALHKLVELVKAGWKVDTAHSYRDEPAMDELVQDKPQPKPVLPATVVQTLRRVLAHLAQNYVGRHREEIAAREQGLQAIEQRFRAECLAASLLA
jgi:hypothetical protein